MAVHSKITDDAALIEFFTTGLKPALVHQILGMDTVPKTIEDWYAKACHFDNQWLKVKAITVMVASYLSSSYLISTPILSNLGAHLISYLIYGCGLVSS